MQEQEGQDGNGSGCGTLRVSCRAAKDNMLNLMSWVIFVKKKQNTSSVLKSFRKTNDIPKRKCRNIILIYPVKNLNSGEQTTRTYSSLYI